MKNWFANFSAMLKEDAPRDAHLWASSGAAVFGAFFVYCGVALAISAAWSRMSNPVLGAVICLVVLGIGTALLFAAWRIYVAARKARL